MLAAFQDAFVALASDGKLRRQFARDPEAALVAFALAPRALAALRALPGADLERYARSLVAKRWGELARVVPLTSRVAPSLADRYRRWALEHPAQAHAEVWSPGVAEALRAEQAMRAALASDGEAPYAADLYAYEARRAASRADGQGRTLASAFALDQIAADVARGLLPIDPDRAPTELVFERDQVRWRRR